MTESQPQTRIPIVFILGSGHCGSTLLDLMLDSHPGVIGVGEMHAVKPDKICTCGRATKDCPFWSDVLQGHWDRQEMYRPKMSFFTGSNDFRSVYTNQTLDSKKFLETTVPMYERMLVREHARLIVDSSKSPDRVALLSQDTRIEPIVIHLVRDGRAVTWAYIRKYKKLFPYFFTWFLANMKVELFKRSFRGKVIYLKYENFADNPENVLRKLSKEIGIAYDPAMMAFREGEHHQANGNRLRFGTDQHVKRDDAWKTDMPWYYRTLFNLCFGWLNLYYEKTRSLS